MVKIGGYKIKNIYGGGYSTLKPDYGNLFTGYRSSVGSLGITTNPQNAAVLKEFSSKINLGVEHVEVEAISPEVFDSMPKQQLKELNSMSKLTGVGVSFHGPIVEPSGLTQSGLTEASKEAAGRQISEAVERINTAVPGTTINFHTSNFLPQFGLSKTEEGEKIHSALVMNVEQGKPELIPIQDKPFPGEVDGKISPQEKVQKEINRLNQRQWESTLSNVGYYGVMGIERVENFKGLARTAEIEKEAGRKLLDEQKSALVHYNEGKLLLNDTYRQIKEIYHLVNKYGADDDRKKLAIFAKEIEEPAKKIIEAPSSPESVELKKTIVEKGLELFQSVKEPPKLLVDANDYMMKQTSSNFGNAAFNAFKKFGEKKAPTIVIENPPATHQFSRAEDVKKIVEGARNEFVAKAKKEGMGESQARKYAEKFIGATWDVGHINMLRQFGFSEKDIVKETEKIAPLVKHVHLSDNFGFHHTELPMGMGNVPLKEMMKKIGEKGFEVKKIVEAGDWWTKHVPQGAGMPFVPSLEGLGSPIYSSDAGFEAPYWNQAIGFQQGYNAGMGEMFPQNYFERTGAVGFSQLPKELGGSKGAPAGSRMSGKPME